MLVVDSGGVRFDVPNHAPCCRAGGDLRLHFCSSSHHTDVYSATTITFRGRNPPPPSRQRSHSRKRSLAGKYQVQHQRFPRRSHALRSSTRPRVRLSALCARRSLLGSPSVVRLLLVAHLCIRLSVRYLEPWGGEKWEGCGCERLRSGGAKEEERPLLLPTPSFVASAEEEYELGAVVFYLFLFGYPFRYLLCYSLSRFIRPARTAARKNGRVYPQIAAKR